MSEFSLVNLHGATYSSDVWSELCLSLFGNENKSPKHWLWVIWNNNRRGLRDRIRDHNNMKGLDSITKDPKTENKEAATHGFESVVQTSRAISELDNLDDAIDLPEPKHNISSLSASPSSNPISQFDHPGREKEIQFVAEIFSGHSDTEMHGHL